MAFAQRLDLRQGQQLVMTPQLQQAIKMLQMTNLELRDFVFEELERNPLLETDDRTPGGDAVSDSLAAPEPERPAEARLERELADDRLGRADETFDTGAENLFADEAVADRIPQEPSAQMSLDGPSGEASAWANVGKGGSSRFEDGEFGLDGISAEAPTLREHLLRQLGETRSAPTARAIALVLIEQLDEAGYLRGDLAQTAERLGASADQMASAVTLLQSFDPTGVGARDLAECLELQLRECNRYDPAMAALLERLELLAKRETSKLLKACRVDQDDLREMIAEIRALDPKPGLRFERDLTQTVTPDVYVSEGRDGGWKVELNSETLPRLLVNSAYAAQVRRLGEGERDPGRSRQVKEYLAECQQNASWLLKSIDQRAKTILRVASEVVRQQDGFLAYGVSALRPLNLKSVAEAIDMHESTVSRVTSNKFISTPRGVFELKYFFTAAIASTDGDVAYSAEAIRHRIRTLIDDEPGDAVLSDDRIVTVLREAGVDIARRTVAKYREAMKIPSSVRRRKQKATDAAL
ncbi:MAG: RNA polymerase factor sigma-54 [Rhodobacteraceae bacterium]|nr:RNA polymerase factor sigma-54 [Paracoccaceae bacterium]